MPTNIDVSLLRVFVAVAETRRMTLAARVVNRTQGAVSQQIARLESGLGVQLFERRHDALRLTASGEHLLVEAQQMIAVNDGLVARMRGTDFAGEVRLGVPPDVVSTLLPPVLRAFRQEHPDLLITLVSKGTRDLRQLLAEDGVDLAVTTEGAAGIDGPLLRDRLVWVGVPGGNAHLRRPLPIALGREDCAFRASAIAALTRAAMDWRAVCQVGSLEPVFATLEADIALGAFLSRTVPERLVMLDASNGLPDLPICFVNLLLPSRGLSNAALALADALRAYFKSLRGNE